MDKADKRAAINAYKERPLDWGVFAIRCSASGQVWIGGSRNLTTQQNGLWFALRMGGNTHRAVQTAWTEHGEASFSFEPLERLPADTPVFARVNLLKERQAHWRGVLGAEAY